MIRCLLFAVACAVIPFTKANAADSPADPMPSALARQVVDKTVELVESEGLYPRQQAEYDQAKVELLALGAGPSGSVDRQEMYRRIRSLLLTLDVDGHSFIIPSRRPSQIPPGPALQESARPPTFSLVPTRYGTVLRWVPPAIVGGGDALFASYLKRFHDAAAAHPGLAGRCALVVDLSEQTGGNAWPPFIAMFPLFSDANNASWVDRAGKRRPFVNRAELEKMHLSHAGSRVNPLARFAGGPVAVLVGNRTASAGEMLLVALLGENRVQTFGSSSAGMSTANRSYPLADGSTLVLTTSRYALGDEPVYRGRIAPMHPTVPDGATDAAVNMAAQWVATNSASCKATSQLP